MTKTPTPNIPLLRKMVEWVEEQAQLTENREWYQADWIVAPSEYSWLEDEAENWCGTACCVAGKVALMDGWKPAFHSGLGLASTVTKDGEHREVREVAAELLGIPDFPDYGGHPLFDGNNTAADIRRIAEEIAGEPL